MSKTNNIIHINGQNYDAVSGAMLSHAPKPAAKPAAGHHGALPLGALPLVPPSARQPLKSVTHKAARPPARHVAAHRPAPAHTLMRQAVHKPTGHKHRLHAQGPVAGTGALTTAPDHRHVTRSRQAAIVAKSELIKHFSAVTATDSAAHPLMVSATPVSNSHGPSIVKPLLAPRPQSKPDPTAALLARALQQATSHQQPIPPKPKSSRAHRRGRLAIASSVAVLLILVLANQTLPRVRLQLASAKAGFGASLPGHQLPGFSQAALAYSPGVVAAQFHSNSDSRRYIITQKPSTWDSDSLRDNFVIGQSDQYQTVTAGGHSVFLYGQGSATWVDHGIWYIIQTDGSLGQRQLVDLAGSL